MSEEQSLLVVSTHGPEDSEKATIPFIVANASLLIDVPTTVFLMAGSVVLAKKGVAETVEQKSGFPNFKELLDNFFMQGGNIKLCGPCCAHRDIKPEDLVKGAEVGGAAGLCDMILDRKVISF